jgi:multiple sugar transport system ATP-binding protein
MTLGERIVIIDKGEIQQIDTPSNLYANPANLFVAGFIGTPPMNFIHGKVIKANDRILFTDNSQIFKVNLPSDHLLMNYIDKEVVLGIRSEDIYNRTKENKNDYAELGCEIKFVEKLGHEIYAYFQLQDQQLISRLKYDAEIMKGSLVSFYFDIRKMYFFDKLTGVNLKMELE